MDGLSDGPLLTAPHLAMHRRLASTSSALAMLNHSEAIPSAVEVAACLAEDYSNLFALHNAPLLHSTLAVIGEAFVSPAQLAPPPRGAARGRGSGNAMDVLAAAAVAAPQSQPIAMAKYTSVPSSSLHDLAPIRRVVYSKAKFRLPALVDSFPWLRDTGRGEGDAVDAAEGASFLSFIPPALDRTLFSSQSPAQWGTTLRRASAASRGTRVAWLDVLHALSDNSAWGEAEGMADAHAALLRLVSEYKGAACADVAGLLTVLTSFGNAASAAEREGPRTRGHRRRPRVRKTAGDGALIGSFVLSTALTPQWLRKLRGHYLKLQRLDLFSALFKACAEAEEGIISAHRARGYAGLVADGDLAVSRVVSSLAVDDEHIGFFVALHGRREAHGTEASKWEGTLDATRWALSRLAVVSPFAAFADRLAPAFRVISNVCAFIQNDGNEDRRVRQLVECCANSGLVDGHGLRLLLDALEASLVRKLAVTKGHSTQSVLRSISPMLTLRHRLLALEAAGAMGDAASVMALVPLLHRHSGTEAVPSSDAAPREQTADEALSMQPAPIERSADDHVRLLAAVVAAVVKVFVESFDANRVPITASMGTLVRWVQHEVHSCTAITDWLACAPLVEALAPMQRLSHVDHYGVSSSSSKATSTEGARMSPEQLMGSAWVCGCGARNTLRAVSCWSCAASKRPPPCGACGADLQAAQPLVAPPLGRSLACGGDEAPCPSCASPHPRTVALKAAGLWSCGDCGALTAEGEQRCGQCSAANPALVRHSCGHCGHSSLGRQGPMCGVCGEATPGADARLVLCGGCSALYPIASNATSCPHCRHKEPTGSVPATVPHFTWVCGCGAQNSPLTKDCRSCGTASAAVGNGAGKAKGNKVYTPPVFTCAGCAAPSPPTRRRIVHSMPLLLPIECKRCDGLHPHSAALLARRSTPCPACHSVIPIGSSSCGACGHAIDAAATRFMPSFANLPWHCHSCGVRNTIQSGDAESALRCAACDVDRVNPLLFSEVTAWDCARCGTQRNYGFTCRKCEGLHSSIPDAEVRLWACASCDAHTPSWRSSCSACDAPRTAPYGDAVEAEVGRVMKYAPWDCSSCRHHNAATRLRKCAECGARRPAVAPCALCGVSHLSASCPPTAVVKREESLEAVLMAAAASARSVGGGVIGGSAFGDIDVSIPSIFDDIIGDMPHVM